jgi:hypothetical protein
VHIGRRYDYRHRVNAKVLVISGSMGAGKTTLLGEVSDLLAASQIVHATIDLDAISAAPLGLEMSRDLASRNLQAIYLNALSVGIDRVLLATAVESRDALERLRQAMCGADLQVCRVMASTATMESRLRIREPGMLQQQFVTRARILEQTLDSARVEHFTVINDQRHITDVARELLEESGWLPQP